LAVTKTVDEADIIKAIDAGVTELGESRVQEALPKIESINRLRSGIRWHFIGHLQTNKVNKIASCVSMIQSVDSLRLAEKISAANRDSAAPLDVLLEIKVSEEDSKFGIPPEEVLRNIKAINKLSGIRLKGFMAMAPYFDNAQEAVPYFRQARKLFDSARAAAPGMDTLSMGMSGDYEAAIDEGATMIRIGSAIFGARNY